MIRLDGPEPVDVTDPVPTLRSPPARGACRMCSARLERTFVDLGMSPLCETFLTKEELDGVEAFYPLHVFVCERCLLVQLEAHVSPEEIFREYPYFSSYSTSWLDHARRFARGIITTQGLGPDSLVVELASNDGYLLQYFRDAGVPVLGIEPARNVALAAEARGIRTVSEFFGRELGSRLAEDGRQADLLVANNVLAHVPDIHDFVGGVKRVLAPHGRVTMEFPHLLRLVEGNQFDTIYHEHFSYLSLLVVERLFEAHGLRVFDVEELPTHGGSLRIHAAHAEAEPAGGDGLVHIRELERGSGMHELRFYEGFEGGVQRAKNQLLRFLLDAREAGKSVAGYGAPGKGNTLLNYCGVRADALPFTVDRNPIKHGRFLPGTHIPVHPTERIREARPDYILILPWNLKDEIVEQLSYAREWGARFVVPIPELEIL